VAPALVQRAGWARISRQAARGPQARLAQKGFFEDLGECFGVFDYEHLIRYVLQPVDGVLQTPSSRNLRPLERDALAVVLVVFRALDHDPFHEIFAPFALVCQPIRLEKSSPSDVRRRKLCRSRSDST